MDDSAVDERVSKIKASCATSVEEIVRMTIRLLDERTEFGMAKDRHEWTDRDGITWAAETDVLTDPIITASGFVQPAMSPVAVEVLRLAEENEELRAAVSENFVAGEKSARREIRRALLDKADDFIIEEIGADSERQQRFRAFIERACEGTLPRSE